MEHDHMSALPGQDAAFHSTTTKHSLQDHKNARSEPRLPHFNFSRKYNSSRSKSPLPPHPPPAYSQSREALNFGSAPSPTTPSSTSTELPPIHPRGSHHDATQNVLPPISSVTGTQPPPSQSRYGSTSTSSVASPSYSSPPAANTWINANPYSAYYSSDEPTTAVEVAPSAIASAAGVNKASPDAARASSLSLDDPDVRMAAEALGDLRADFLSSPPHRGTPLPIRSSTTSSTGPQPEPLISLLTTSHPLLAKTIEGTTSAYNNSKNISPRFRSSVEYVEGYLTPIGNTIGTVGRATGVEGGVRWFLGSGRRNLSGDADDGSYKRRKLDTPNHSRRGSNATITHHSTNSVDSAADPYAFDNGDRRMSMSTIETIDTLPPYDDARSPAYAELLDGGPLSTTSTSSSGEQRSGAVTPRPKSGAGPAPWQSRLIMSTSGLSIAMSEESLRRLKYCLRWLRWANEHIANVINALKSALEQYEHGNDEIRMRSACGALEPLVRSRNAEVIRRIAELKTDILKTLRECIDTVSKYAGGSLPENASILVRKHLTSLPQRFRLASQTEASKPAQGERAAPGGAESDKDTTEAAQRVLLLAKEGLDMMSQVSGVLDGTIVSAEEWCTKLGRKIGDEINEGDGQAFYMDGRTRDLDGDAVMSS